MPANQATVNFPSNDRYHALSANQGGMGIVYFCEDRITGDKVALKTYRPELIDQQRVQLRFLHEVSEWIYLGQHPNIVQALRVEALGNPPRPYLILEGISPPGEAEFGQDVSLQSLIQKQSRYGLSFARSLTIMLEVANAMEHATRRIPGMVHRDIKPANILLDRFGVARLSDFGIARSFADVAGQLALYSIDLEKVDLSQFKPAGSPFYVAPEQWTPGNVPDQKVDIYALGLCLFEMITGKKRAQGNSFDQLRDVHTAGRLTPIPESAPAPLNGLIETCCALKPSDRFANWTELRYAIINCYTELTGHKPKQPPTIERTEQVEQQSHIVSYLTIADSYQKLNYPDTALKYCEAALEVAEQIEHAPSVIDSLNKLAEANEMLGCRDNAMELLERSTALAKEVNDSVRHIDGLLIWGNLFARAERHADALGLMETAITIAGKINSPQLEAIALGNLANVYAQAGDYPAAIEQYKKQLTQFCELNDQLNEVKCLANLGTALFDHDRLDEASEAFKQCRDRSQSIAEASSYAVAIESLVTIYERQNRLEDGVTELQDYHARCIKRGDATQAKWAQAELNRIKLINS